jgi:hypothetical protein
VTGAIRRRYIIEPRDGIRSSRLLLNGVPVEEDLLFAWGRESTKRKYRAATDTAAPSTILLPPYGCAFVQIRVAPPKAVRAS